MAGQGLELDADGGAGIGRDLAFGLDQFGVVVDALWVEADGVVAVG